MSEEPSPNLSGPKLYHYRRSLTREALGFSGCSTFTGVMISSGLAGSGVPLEETAAPGLALLAVFATVSIALHVPIWTTRLRADDPKGHMRAAHLYMFAGLIALLGLLSCAIAGVMTVDAFTTGEADASTTVEADTFTAGAFLAAVGAWALAWILCVLAVAAREITYDDVITTMAEEDRKQTYRTLGERARRLAPMRAGGNGNPADRLRSILLAGAYGLAVAIVAIIVTSVVILCIDDASWTPLAFIAIGAPVGTALTYAVLYSWAVRWGPELYMNAVMLLLYVGGAWSAVDLTVDSGGTGSPDGVHCSYLWASRCCTQQ